MSYDEKCYGLAEAFLDDTDTQHINTEFHRDKLAQAVQDAVESYMVSAKDNYEPPDDPDAWSGGFADNH